MGRARTVSEKRAAREALVAQGRYRPKAYWAAREAAHAAAVAEVEARKAQARAKRRRDRE